MLYFHRQRKLLLDKRRLRRKNRLAYKERCNNKRIQILNKSLRNIEYNYALLQNLLDDYINNNMTELL